jgi:hypothetical protein
MVGRIGIASDFMRALKIITAAGTLTAGSFIYPLPAHADDPCTGDAPGCPTFGHLVCQQLDAGLTSGQTPTMRWQPGAIVKYCPSYEGY